MALLKLKTHNVDIPNTTEDVIVNLAQVASFGEGRDGYLYVGYVSGQRQTIYNTPFESICSDLQRGADFILGTDRDGDRILTNINAASTMSLQNINEKTTLTATFHRGGGELDRISVKSILGVNEAARFNSMVVEPNTP